MMIKYVKWLLVIAVFLPSTLFAKTDDKKPEAKKKKKEYPLIAHPSKFNLGVGLGVANVYGDLHVHVPTLAGRIGIGRNLTNFLTVGLEYYSGTLASRDDPNNWTTGLTSRSQFYALDFNAKMSLGVFFNKSETKRTKILTKFYIGSGLGYISATILNITDRFKKTDLTPTLEKYIKRHDAQYAIPMNIGYRTPLKKFLGTQNTKLMVNYNLSYTNSDYMDGYALKRRTSYFKDVYGILTIGLSLSLEKNKDSFHWLKKEKNNKVSYFNNID